MSTTTALTRRIATGTLGAAAFAGLLMATAPVASAIPQNCTAGDLANVTAGVSAASAAYLFTHPEVNDYLTSLRNDTDEQAIDALQQYLDANPRIKDELRAVRQPLEDLKNRCRVADDPTG